MNGQLYNYLIEQFKREIGNHVREMMVGKMFTIVYGGKTYNLTIDKWEHVDVDLTATFEIESPWWRRDRESLSD